MLQHDRATHAVMSRNEPRYRRASADFTKFAKIADFAFLTILAIFRYPTFALCYLRSAKIGSFRLDYEYEIEYEYEFRIPNQWCFQSPCSSCWF